MWKSFLTRGDERAYKLLQGLGYANQSLTQACPCTPVGVRASDTQCSCQWHEWYMSASWTTVPGTSKCYQKPCLTLIFLLFQDNDETVEMLASFVDSYPDSDEWEFEYARQVPFFIPFWLCKQFFLVKYFFDFLRLVSSNSQRFQGAGNNDWWSKHFCSDAELCARFMW